MSDIKVGDLVRIVKWPCCGKHIGTIRTVTEIYPEVAIKYKCMDCKSEHLLTVILGVDHTIPEHLNYVVTFPLSWVKKIDPPSIPETIEKAIMA